MRNFLISFMCPHFSNLLLRKVHPKTQAYNSNSHTGISRFIVLHRYCIFFFFLQIESLYVDQVYGLHFSKTICSFCVSVSNSGNSCSISNFFMIIVFVM